MARRSGLTGSWGANFETAGVKRSLSHAGLAKLAEAGDVCQGVSCIVLIENWSFPTLKLPTSFYWTDSCVLLMSSWGFLNLRIEPWAKVWACFMMKVVRHYKQVAQRSCGCPSLEKFKVRLDMHLAGGWSRVSLKVLSNPNHSLVIIWWGILVPVKFLSELEVIITATSQHKRLLFLEVEHGSSLLFRTDLLA